MRKCGGTEGAPGRFKGSHPKHNLLLMYTTCKGCPDCKPDIDWCECGVPEDDHIEVTSYRQTKYVGGVGWTHPVVIICPRSMFRRQE